MPELPEVEVLRRELAPILEGARIERVVLHRLTLRRAFPDEFDTRIAGASVLRLRRRAKYLLADLSSGETVIVHLGMSGWMRSEPAIFTLTRHDHVVFALTNGRAIVFNDPRRFGFMLFADANNEHPMLADLGVEPTGNALDGKLLTDLLRGRKAPLKAALLDQTLIAGLGNIYVAEALWRAGLSPRRAAGTIAPANGKAGARAEKLATAIRSVIADAIEAGGSSLRDYVHADGSLGYFQHSFSVYDREGEPCRKDGCTGTISRIVQSGRSTFYCPVCQH